MAAVMPLTVMAPLVAPSPMLPASETNSVAAAVPLTTKSLAVTVSVLLVVLRPLVVTSST